MLNGKLVVRSANIAYPMFYQWLCPQFLHMWCVLCIVLWINSCL